MKKIEFEYADIIAPCTVLIRNLQFEDDESATGIIAFGEIIASGKTMNELMKHVPKPEPLNDLKSLMKLAGREGIIECNEESFVDEINSYPEEDFLRDLDISADLDLEQIEKEIFLEEDPYYYNVNLEPYYLDNLITDLDVFATSYSTIFFISNDKIEVKEYILERIDALKNKGYSDYKIFQIIHYRYLENMLEIQIPGMHYGSEMLEYIHTILPAEITHFYNL